MLRVNSVGKNFLALLLPVTFFLSWAACESFCAEITDRLYDHQTSAGENHLEDENCRSAGSVYEGCRLTANAAVVEARQTVKLTALSASSPSTLQSRVPLPARLALLPEIRQNSPPIMSTAPLFARLCTFRI